MKIIKKTIFLLQVLVFITLSFSISFADSWIDNLNVSDEFEKIYYTRKHSVAGGTEKKIHIKTPKNRTIIFSIESGTERNAIALFKDTGKKIRIKEKSKHGNRSLYYAFLFENKITGRKRCFSADQTVNLSNSTFYGFNVMLSKNDFNPTSCKLNGMDFDCKEFPESYCLK